MRKKVGLIHISLKIANPANPRRFARVRCLVDSGAVYSHIPSAVLRRIGIVPRSTRTFALADGSVIRRRMGEARFTIDGQSGTSPVVFGERGDYTLVGTVSLEVLGLLLDPLRRELRPMRLLLV